MIQFLEEWIAKRWIRKQVVQGNHVPCIRDLYAEIEKAAKAEFIEDNEAAIHQLLSELFIITNTRVMTKSDHEFQIIDILSRLGRIMEGEFGDKVGSFIRTYIDGKYWSR
jgi:hypothetical protein